MIGKYVGRFIVVVSCLGAILSLLASKKGPLRERVNELIITLILLSSCAFALFSLSIVFNFSREF